MIWGPVQGAMAYVGIRLNFGKLCHTHVVIGREVDSDRLIWNLNLLKSKTFYNFARKDISI